MAAVESEADDKFANVDVDSLLSRVGRRPLTFSKTRSLYRAPEFEKRLSGEETADEGSSVQFEMKVNGFPKPVLKWYKDGEEILDHPRIHVEDQGNGVYLFTLEHANKGDAASYRCRAENEEGSCSCLFYLNVKGKPKSPKRSKGLTKRSVSYPPMFPTIVERVEEEEKEGNETARSPPSPLTQLYDGLTLQTRHTWPKFLGDWAYVDSAHRNGGSLGSESESETGDGHSLDGAEQEDDVFSEDSCEKSCDEGSVSSPCEEGPASASFYLSSNETSPDALDSENGNVSVGAKSESDIAGVSVQTNLESVTQKSEPNNNETKVSKGKRDLHLPLTNGVMSNSASSGVTNTNGQESKNNIKKKDKSSSVKTNEEKKKNAENVKQPKKQKVEEKSDKIIKKSELKEKHSKKVDSKEKSIKRDSQYLGSKKSDQKEESKVKSKDDSKPSSDKLTKKSDLKVKKTDSPKRKSDSKEKRFKPEHTIDNDPPILGSARPLVFTNVASKTVPSSCTSASNARAKQDDAITDVNNSIQSADSHVCKGNSNSDKLNIIEPTSGPPQIVNVPFGRFFEEAVFIVCLFTFLALCIGIPTEIFVLVVLSMHFFYSMATILGLC